MLRLLSIILSIALSLGFVSYTSAVEADLPASSATGSQKIELTIKTVKTLDSGKVRIVFTDAIDVSSVILKISKQSDNSSIGISSITGVVDAPEAIDVSLDDDLEEGSSYSLTIIAAIGLAGSTITDGASALADFVTPTPLKKATRSFNAPANPSAVLAEPTKTPPVITPEPEEEEEVGVIPTEELPLTGMNPLLLLVIILPLAYGLLRKVKISA